MNAAFWIAVLGLGLPAYAYAGYPLLLFLLAAVVQTGRDAGYLLFREDRRRRKEHQPRVSVIVAAHNEEEVISRTLQSILAVDYPAEQLEVILGSDASSDRTVEVARRYESGRVRIAAFAERRGKLAVITDCVRQARGDILVFTDANTVLHRDSVRNLARRFADPRVGAVCGELHLVGASGNQADEGIYWRYEATLKMLESRLDSTLGANGAIYALRRELFPAVPGHWITDDFVIPMKVRSQGFRVIYDPESTASEEAPATVADEFRRRTRIGAGNWQALWHCRDLLLPWKGFISLAFWSHKVIRWLAPFLMAAGLAANVFLLSQRAWQVVFAAQAAFYGCALLGGALCALRLPAGPLRTVYYFVAINAALAIGLLKTLFGAKRATWARTTRAPLQAGNKP